jgi:hypothetical protein
VSSEAGFVLFLNLVVVAMVLLVWAGQRWDGWRDVLERWRIRRAQEQLAPCLGLPELEEGAFEGAVVVGRYAGHRLRLWEGRRKLADSSIPVLRYALRLPGRAYSQDSVFLDDLRETLGEGAQAGAVRGALGHLGTISGAELAVADGWLVLERTISNYAFTHASMTRTLGALVQLVPLFARAGIDVHVSPRAGQPVVDQGATPDAAPLTLAWREHEGGDALCPYCRDSIQDDALELARCEDCHTLQHAECLEEAGRCSIFGCGSQRRQRVALRARG